MNANETSDLYYFILLTIGALSAIINIFKAFKKSDKEAQINELKKIIGDQKNIINRLEAAVLKYQELIRNDTGGIG